MLSRRIRVASVFIAVVPASAGAVSDATAQVSPQRYSVIAADEKVGSLVATGNGTAIEITYEVDNNGRGPKMRERIVIGEKSIPTQWHIQGRTMFGSQVDELYTWRNGTFEWRSQADRGRQRSKQPKLYVANDASPWSLGLYARALLQAPDHKLAVAPGGELRLERIDETRLGPQAVSVYALSGVGLTPEVILLDEDGQLFAHLSSTSLLVREGSESYASELMLVERQARAQRLVDLQKHLARRFDTPVRIRNVRVFDPRKLALSEAVSVVIFRNRIASVATQAADAAAALRQEEVVVDGEGGTLVAGLHDMHSHNSAESGLFYLAAGVTTVRDLGNDNEVLLDLTQRIDAGELPGPRIVRAGFLEGRSPYSARHGFIPTTLPEALDRVRWYADHGYRQIKIYNSFNPEWIKPVAAQAHRLGLRVSGHVPAFTTPDRAILDGYDEINHINQLMLGWLTGPGDDTRTTLRLTAMGERAAALDLGSAPVRNTVALMKERGIALDTTSVILERLLASRSGKVHPGDVAFIDHVPIGYQRERKRAYVEFKDAAHEETYQRSLQKIVDVMRLLHREGVRMLPGTDNDTGFTVHRELELYAQAGIPAAEVLRMATYDCEVYLGNEEDLGSIEPGKLADFILVAGDPTQDLSAVRQIRLVMKDGLMYFPSEIYEALGIRPFTRAPQIENHGREGP